MLASSSRQALSVARKRVPLSAKCLSPGAILAFDSFTPHQAQRHLATLNIRRPKAQEYDEEFEYESVNSSSSNLRNKPYDFARNFKPRPHTFSFNQRLETQSSRLALVQMMQTMKEMKDAGTKPDFTTYNAVLEALGTKAMEDEAWALFDDMLGVQITPDVQTFNSLLLATQNADMKSMHTILGSMAEHGVEPDPTTYMHMIRKLTRSGNLEACLRALVEMEGKDLSPRVETAEELVTLAASQGHPRLAIDLAVNFEVSSPRRLNSAVWIKCLIAAAGDLYKDGVVLLWNKIVKELKITPDEGTCLEVLHTAGRHGLPELSTEVLGILQSKGVTLREYHFAPIVEAYCRIDLLKEAFGILSFIRSKGLLPTAETAYPILDVLRASPDAVDTAWTAIEDLEQENEPIDVTALNVVIQGAVAHGDLQRAFGVYQLAPELKVKPNVDTFNALFSGCIAAAHKELGEKILADMKEAKIKPDAQTYERLVVLSLSGETYEEAFFYLEEMKSANFYPPLAVYEAIITRCADAGDTRYKIAAEELQDFGYELSPKLAEYIKTKSEGQKRPSRSLGPNETRERRQDEQEEALEYHSSSEEHYSSPEESRSDVGFMTKSKRNS